MDDRKTKPEAGDVDAFLEGVVDDKRRHDAQEALALLREVTGAEPVIWGETMIGFGTQRYTTADGRQREWFAVGLSPRKSALTLYGLTYYGSHGELLDRLGPHKTGKCCLYVKDLDALDRDVLTELVERSWAENHDG